MAAKGWLVLEKMRRIIRTVFFMVAMVASLLVSSLPVLVALGDILVPCVLISSFTCVGCYGFREHLHRYHFKSSLIDIPLVSVVRSLIIACMYYDRQLIFSSNSKCIGLLFVFIVFYFLCFLINVDDEQVYIRSAMRLVYLMDLTSEL